jgi:2-polyprenyl-3-methyl-5-hydroxy-6-metoxy-1,4-benzoquinol methylase
MSAPAQPDQSEALVERLFGATVNTLELYSVYLGNELGLYRLLDERDGGLTVGELAAEGGIAERYAREWLEQQAVAGFLDVDDADATADARRYSLPAEHARVLADPADAAHVAPFAQLVAGVGRVLEKVATAYRTGDGVPYADYGAPFRHGQAAINRPAFSEELPGPWLGAMPDVRERLERGGRVADVGCGEGWSTLAIARAFPQARVDGLDLDSASIADAQGHAAEMQVDGRVRFLQSDAEALAGEGPYDLVMVLEALHDFTRPVEALRAMRSALADGGAVLVVDERVADAFTAPGDEIERMMYGWSIVHCLPTQLVDEPTAATGTVMRADTLRRYAEEAGFGRLDVLPVENDFFRLYRLDG